MSTPEEQRLNYPQGAAGNDAYDAQQARMAADAAQMAAGAAAGHDEQLTHHQGLPTVQEQMATHVAPPAVPDTGGHDSPSARIG